jgi:hypothetical protein
MIRFHVKKNQQRRLGDYVKDPDETVWLEVVWDAYLGDDTIDSVAWRIDHMDDLTNGDDLSIDDTEDDQTSGDLAHINRAQISGGFVSMEYIVTNRVTTSAGEIKDVSVLIRCRER